MQFILNKSKTFYLTLLFVLLISQHYLHLSWLERLLVLGRVLGEELFSLRCVLHCSVRLQTLNCVPSLDSNPGAFFLMHTKQSLHCLPQLFSARLTLRHFIVFYF